MTDLSDQFAREHTTPAFLDALQQGHFVLYGQPIIALSAGAERSRYLEVLVRYAEEEEQSLPPGGFFEVLEELNLVSVLDRWVINRVVRALITELAAHGSESAPRYSVNLSVDSLYDVEFCPLMLEYFERNRLPSGKLCLEILEVDAHAHSDEISKLTSSLGPVGCGITLASYSGEHIPPGSLRDLGVDTVKIDGQLVGGIAHNIADSARVKAIHLMCRKLGIRTVAEMVEQRGALDKLKKIGIDYAQGYAIAKPVPLHSLISN